MTRRYRPFDPFERGPFEPPRELRVPRPPRRFWIGVGLFGVASLIFIFASPIVSLITELQWYNALGFKDIYTTRLVLQTVLFVGSLAIAHLSATLAVCAVALAGWLWLGRFDLLYSHNSSVVWGAAYTDVNARMPLMTFEAGAGIVLAGGLVANLWVRRLWVPLAAAGLFVAMLVLGQV